MRNLASIAVVLLVLVASVATQVLGADPEPMRIGILVPLDGPDKVSGQAVIAGVEQAVQEWKRANPSSPLSKLETCIIPSQLRWGAQTDALVDAVFDAKTSVVIGAADRRTAHLAAQVITRLKGTALLVTFSEDATLTKIGVPWILRFPVGSGTGSGNSAKFGKATGPSSASLEKVAHDAARSILLAMSDCGPDITAMRSFLSAHTFPGSTGRFTFDPNGNRIAVK